MVHSDCIILLLQASKIFLFREAWCVNSKNKKKKAKKMKNSDNKI